jgi:hypothetical protein
MLWDCAHARDRTVTGEPITRGRLPLLRKTEGPLPHKPQVQPVAHDVSESRTAHGEELGAVIEAVFVDTPCGTTPPYPTAFVEYDQIHARMVQFAAGHQARQTGANYDDGGARRIMMRR